MYIMSVMLCPVCKMCYFVYKFWNRKKEINILNIQHWIKALLTFWKEIIRANLRARGTNSEFQDKCKNVFAVFFSMQGRWSHPNVSAEHTFVQETFSRSQRKACYFHLKDHALDFLEGHFNIHAFSRWYILQKWGGGTSVCMSKMAESNLHSCTNPDKQGRFWAHK